MKPCFLPADILLPRESVDLTRWAVVACDQFTSRQDYWTETEHLVGDVPSTLRLVYPEIYLSQGDKRILAIHAAMRKYLEEGVLKTAVTNGFVFVRRTTKSGTRLGLVGKLDLEQYEYKRGKKVPVRATEGTILSRIPPRMRIRENALIESPHIMMLLDDPAMCLIEPLEMEDLPKLYDITLMQGGGRLEGFAVEGERAKQVAKLSADMQAAAKGGFFLAAGDGNHSLATAKACWEERKKTLSSVEWETHPARFALVELVNLHSPALIFEPIHRVIFGAAADELVAGFDAYLASLGMAIVPGEEVVFVGKDGEMGFDIAGRGERLPLDLAQGFLDEWLERHENERIDYVHDANEVRTHCCVEKAAGVLFQSIPKEGFFAAVRAGGALPRKTFSMGEGCEKRYYMECRRILPEEE